jgi:tetratricopeptide (TPR) repeat protein
VDLSKIGQELKVRAVLTGRVVQRGDSLSIQTELVDVAQNSQLWGERYNRKLADIGAIEEEIAREISDKIRLRLTGEQEKRLARRPTENAEAYQEYLKGRYFWNRRTGQGLRTALDHFENAIAKDPGFALAYAGVADCYALSQYAGAPPRDSYPKARAAAQKALALDDTLAEAYNTLASIKSTYEWDWQGAERDFKKALELNPGYATAHQWYGEYLVSLGRFDEGLAEVKRAQELDPLSLIIQTTLGGMYRLSRRYDEAIEQGRAALGMDSNFGVAHFTLGRAYAAKSMYSEAIREYQAALKLMGEDPLLVSYLGVAYGRSGKKAEAQKILDALIERSKRGYMPASAMATAYLGLGDKDQAFRWLAKGIEEREPFMSEIAVDPLYDPLRSDPRFADLLRRTNLER